MHKLFAVVLILIGSFFSCTDDVFQKLLSDIGYHPFQITFGRTFFSTLFLLPFVLKYKLFRTKIIHVHILRSLLFVGMLFFYILGLNKVSMSLNALIGFAPPILMILFSRIFLKEDVTLVRKIVATITFASIAFAIDFSDAKITIGCLFISIGYIIYAGMETLNKYLLVKTNENKITMVFYYNLFAFLIVLVPTYQFFILFDLKSIVYLMCLGLGSDLFFLSFLKAFSLGDISFLSTFKYSEFIYKSLLGVLIFKETLRGIDFLAMIIIAVANLFSFFYEKEVKK